MKPKPRRRPAAALLVALALLALVPGCTPGQAAKFAPILADVALVLAQAGPAISLAEAAAAAFFAAHPNPGAQASVAEAIADARAGIVTAASLVHGADDLTQADADAAFKDFRAAWAELSKLLEQLGAVGKDGKFAVAPGGRPALARLPEPLAAHFTARPRY